MGNGSIKPESKAYSIMLLLWCHGQRKHKTRKQSVQYDVTFLVSWPGRVVQSVGHLTGKSGILGSIPGQATYFRFSFHFFKKGSCQYWRKYVHEVLVNRLGGLSLPRKSVVRLTDRPGMTLDVYRERKTTMQQQQQQLVSWAMEA